MAIESIGIAGRITVPFSQQFLRDALSVLGPSVAFDLSLCLIPRDLDPSTITKLDDVRTKGGHVFRPTYGGGVELGPAGHSSH